MSNNRPLVSIGIPTYNRADSYLKEAVQSALNQNYAEIEIIISDNCSSDNTEEVVKGFKDKRIRYFRQEKNIGANNNFNFCLSQAKGDYFLLLQDDDLIDEDFVETCLNAAAFRTDYGLIRTGTRIIDARGEILKLAPNRSEGTSLYDFFMNWFGFKTSLYLCSTLFNTRGLKEIGGFKSKYNLFQDVVAEVKLAAKYGVLEIFDIKASFRKHPNEMTFASKVNDWCEDSLYLLDIMCDLIPDKDNTIRKEGLKFFAHINYNRARAVRRLPNRMLAYLNVYRKFNYRYLPPSLNMLLYRNKISRAIRLLKRTMVR